MDHPLRHDQPRYWLPPVARWGVGRDIFRGASFSVAGTLGTPIELPDAR